MREAGILLPIFSLPNEYGIGTLGKEAYDFVDFLVSAKQSYWQILPIGPTSYHDSPYSSFSVHAGNPYFIDFLLLEEQGLLRRDEYEYLKDESLYIAYGKIYETRFIVLRKAYERFDKSLMKSFIKENAYWLDDYALFMSLKNAHGGVSFFEWEDEYKFRDAKALKKYKKDNSEDVDFWKFVQYIFFDQFLTLKAYANKKGIKIIGDMPIYAALDSADVWANKDEFQINADFSLKAYAGCPVDKFSPDGQAWGNPLYNWDKMKEEGYAWWINRIKTSHKLFDVIRIDHFRGFEAYFSIPFGKEPIDGVWKKGPNTALFKAIEKEFGTIDIIAENLGHLTPAVDKMLNKLGYPGMEVLQFNFDKTPNGKGLFDKISFNTVVYPGTHDNPTTVAWFQDLSEEDKALVYDYLHFDSAYEACNMIIRASLMSPGYLAVISFFDYLQRGREARINTPSIPSGNWQIRIEKGDLNSDLASYIAHLTTLYHREK